MKLQRRTFLTGLGVPLILGADNKSGSKKPVLGEGDHEYEVTHDWGELPASIQYGNTHGVCEDSQGRIYIHHTVNASSESSDTMVVFDPKATRYSLSGREIAPVKPLLVAPFYLLRKEEVGLPILELKVSVMGFDLCVGGVA
jgi:hypothetical protein